MIKTYLTSEEIQQMIGVASTLRDKVILSFYGDTGCRASELLRLKVEDVDFETGIVRIPHLKRGIKKKCPVCDKTAGRRTAFCSKCGYDLSDVKAEGIEERSRLISIGNETRELLRVYLQDSAPEDKIINISRQRVHGIVRQAGINIGLKGKAIINPETGKKHYVHPHLFRDSLAVAWLGLVGNDAGKQKALQDHLGHRNFDTTMRYHKLTPEAVQDVSNEVRQARFKEVE